PASASAASRQLRRAVRAQRLSSARLRGLGRARGHRGVGGLSVPPPAGSANAPTVSTVLDYTARSGTRQDGGAETARRTRHGDTRTASLLPLDAISAAATRAKRTALSATTTPTTAPPHPPPAAPPPPAGSRSPGPCPRTHPPRSARTRPR